MSAAERVYRLLLRAYPPEFRAAYGREMALLFRDLRRGPGTRGARFWAAMAWDVARSAPAQRLEAWRGRWSGDTRTREGTMVAMAILAILIGAMATTGGLAEVWIGGMINHQGYPLVGGTIGAVAGALLLSSGIAMLRRSRGATALARGAAVTSILVFVLIGLVKPLAGYLITMLGIGFPVALLLFLRRGGGRGLHAAPAG